MTCQSLNVFADGLWFPDAISNEAGESDGVFWLTMAISAFFFVLIVGVMTAFVVRYRRRANQGPIETPKSSLVLEILWTAVPALLLAVIFFSGFKTFMSLSTVDESQEPVEIRVIGKKWVWSFVYPNGYVDNNLHVPVNRPVILTMRSDDVIHSLYIPALRLKRDTLPGRYTKMVFRANETGSYTIYCAEYCGTKHSDMLAKLIVHPSGEYAKWLEEASNFLDRMTPAEGGKLLYTRRGCAQCHSVDGSARVGPTFYGLYRSEQVMRDGERLTVDDNYIRESILNPQKRVRAGYRPVMPTYQGQLREEEIAAIIEYIKTLKK